MSVRPELGPSLPELLAARGVSRRAMALGAALLVLAAVGGWTLLQSLRDREQLVVDGPPSFNLVYAPSALHEAPRRRGELARLEGHRRNVRVEITARRVEVPPYPAGDAVAGYLPVLAERRLRELAEQYGPVDVYDEGKARINDLPGYQIGFSARVASGALFGRDTYVLPDGADPEEGVLLSLRRVVRHRATAADRDYFDVVKEAYVSFAFGHGRP